MQRARRTAEIAGFADPTITPLLCEFDYGEYEGMTTKAIHEKRPDWELFKDGCPGGESPQQVYERAQAFIKLVTAAGARVVAFAHGHILRAVAVAWLELPIAAGRGFQLDVATLSLLRDGDHGRVIATWNAP
jgi:broad specificity phosphatase PhoE